MATFCRVNNLSVFYLVNDTESCAKFSLANNLKKKLLKDFREINSGQFSDVKISVFPFFQGSVSGIYLVLVSICNSNNTENGI